MKVHLVMQTSAVAMILAEGVLIALVGGIFSFAANQASPRGLALARDYFPGSNQKPAPSMHAESRGAPGVAVATPTSPADLLKARLKTKGLQLVDSYQVAELFRDPRYEQDLVVFVDARDDAHYQEGHIPAAYQFDHYRPEKYIGSVLPACYLAQQIVVYCTGGDCEDSEFTAVTLGDAGIGKEKLFVYGGGISEWITNGLPVELGERKSGNLRNSKP